MKWYFLFLCCLTIPMTVHEMAGCSQAKPPTVQQAAAEGAYTAELVACVEEAKTLAESKACRAEVNKRWGVVETRSAR